MVCLVLALCIAFSYFQQGGWLLDRPAALCRGLVGYGYYTVAPVLLLVSYILLFHRGRNVTACVVGAALLRCCSARCSTSCCVRRSTTA